MHASRTGPTSHRRARLQRKSRALNSNAQQNLLVTHSASTERRCATAHFLETTCWNLNRGQTAQKRCSRKQQQRYQRPNWQRPAKSSHYDTFRYLILLCAGIARFLWKKNTAYWSSEWHWYPQVDQAQGLHSDSFFGIKGNAVRLDKPSYFCPLSNKFCLLC